MPEPAFVYSVIGSNDLMAEALNAPELKDYTLIAIVTKNYWDKNQCLDDSGMEPRGLDEKAREVGVHLCGQVEESVYEVLMPPKELESRLQNSPYFVTNEKINELCKPY